jgi:hypothetical protein
MFRGETRTENPCKKKSGMAFANLPLYLYRLLQRISIGRAAARSPAQPRIAA